MAAQETTNSEPASDSDDFSSMWERRHEFGGWRAVMHAVKNRYYYFNVTTKETVWREPPAYTASFQDAYENMVSAVQAVFDLVDKNQDGSLSRIEIIKALRDTAESQTSPLLCKLLNLPTKIQASNDTHAVSRGFQPIDGDDSNSITRKEWTKYFHDQWLATLSRAWSTGSLQPRPAPRHQLRKTRGEMRPRPRPTQAPNLWRRKRATAHLGPTLWGMETGQTGAIRQALLCTRRPIGRRGGSLLSSLRPSRPRRRRDPPCSAPVSFTAPTRVPTRPRLAPRQHYQPTAGGISSF